MKNSFLKDYLVTLSSSLLVAGFSFVLYKLVYIYYEAEGLDFFALIRRYQSAVVPLVMLGYGVVIPKYLAQGRMNDDSLLIAISVSTFLFLLLLACAFALDVMYVYAVLFSGPAMVAGYIYAIYRGRALFGLGAFSNIFVLVVLPAVSFFVFDSIKGFVIGYCLASFFYLISWLVRGRLFVRFWLKRSIITENLSISLKSLGRLPSDLLNQLIYVAPVYIAGLSAPDETGRLSLALSLLLAFAVPIRPVSTLLLVKLSIKKTVKKQLLAHLAIYILVSVFCGIAFVLVSGLINSIYYNDDEFKALLVSLAPVVSLNILYVFLRSYVDAYFEFPLLSLFNGISFAVLVLLMLVTQPSHALMLALATNSLLIMLSLFLRRS